MQRLYNFMIRQKSCLCVGLDPDLRKIPEIITKNSANPIYDFNKVIVDATAKYCVAYKPNIAFYEAYGLPGLKALQDTIEYIKKSYPEHYVILDAKRGDIGNTSEMYAQMAYDVFNLDGVTVNPYMGEDSVRPFLREGKWAVILGLTSNPGSCDFQLPNDLWCNVLSRCAKWGSTDDTMFVVGATHESVWTTVRNILPDHCLLVPGVGAQGGSLDTVLRCGLNSRIGLLINMGRSILYASSGDDFGEKAGAEAKKTAETMWRYIKDNKC